MNIIYCDAYNIWKCNNTFDNNCTKKAVDGKKSVLEQAVTPAGNSYPQEKNKRYKNGK